MAGPHAFRQFSTLAPQLERISLDYIDVKPRVLSRLPRFWKALRLKQTTDAAKLGQSSDQFHDFACIEGSAKAPA